jgi:hypothetical protein
MKLSNALFLVLFILYFPFILWADESLDTQAVRETCELSDHMKCFSDGETAYAKDINDNFKALYNQLQDLIAMECSYNQNSQLCPNSNEVFVFKAYRPELNTSAAFFMKPELGHNLMVIPALGTGGWNPHSLEGDFGLIWTDSKGPNNMNGSSGMVIGPHSNSAAGIKIQANGNVGIGVAQPSAKLHVAGEIISDTLTCNNLRHSNRFHISGGEELFILNKKGAVISSAWGGTGSLLMDGHLIMAAGDPYIKNNRNDNHIIISGGSGWAETGGIVYVSGANAPHNPHGVSFFTGNKPTFTIDKNGDVSMNGLFNCSEYRSPGRMHISGGERLYLLNKDGVHISKAWGGSGDLLVEGNVTAQNYHKASDIRFKKDITPVTNSLSRILALIPKYFYWKIEEFKEKHFSTKKQIGFIANEVETIIPEAVHTDKEGIKYIEYDKITPVMVGSIQELSLKITALENENIALKQKIAGYDQLALKVASLESIIQSSENKRLAQAANPLALKHIN